MVSRNGFPKSFMDLLQEADRNQGSGSYRMCLNFDNFIYMCERIYVLDEIIQLRVDVISPEELKKCNLELLRDVARLIFLNLGCWHYYLENLFANSSLTSRMDEKC